MEQKVNCWVVVLPRQLCGWLVGRVSSSSSLLQPLDASSSHRRMVALTVSGTDSGLVLWKSTNIADSYLYCSEECTDRGFVPVLLRRMRYGTFLPHAIRWYREEQQQRMASATTGATATEVETLAAAAAWQKTGPVECRGLLEHESAAWWKGRPYYQQQSTNTGKRDHTNNQQTWQTDSTEYTSAVAR